MLSLIQSIRRLTGEIRDTRNRLAFFSAILFSMLAHLYRYTNAMFSHDSLGHVLLYHCSRVEGTGTSIFPVESWQKLTPEAEGNAVSLPLRMIAGEECLLTGFGMEKLCRAGTLVLDGEGLEATLCGHGHVIGRIQLKTADYPEVRGGSSRRIYVPESWNDEEMVLHLSALGKEGTLAGISWEMIHA